MVFFRQLDCPTADLQEAENTVFREAMKNEGLPLPTQAENGSEVEAQNAGVCAGFWKSPVVGWDGRVTTCTRDSHMRNQVGDLRTTTFSELWWSENMRRRRFMVAQRDYSDLSLCQSCFIPRSLNYTGITEEELRQYGEQA